MIWQWAVYALAILYLYTTLMPSSRLTHTDKTIPSSSSSILSLVSTFVPLAFPLYLSARMNQTVRFYLRLTLYCTTLGLTSIWAVFLSIALSLVGKSASIQHYVARSFYYFASPVLGWSLRVEGREHLSDDGCTVFVGNHQSCVVSGSLPQNCTRTLRLTLSRSACRPSALP